MYNLFQRTFNAADAAFELWNIQYLHPNQKCDVPAVNVIKDTEKFCIEMSVPGISKDDLKVKISDGVLTISYEKKEHAECGGKYIRNEFTHESFERSFSIPDCVDDKSISSSCKDGVLSVVLPFAEGSKLSRTVPVN